jgi:cytochrome c-type biogenesis protein CcmH
VATARPDAPPGALTQHAEAIVGMEDGVVTPPVLALIDRALERDPAIPAAHYYRAQAAAQSGDPAGGREILLARLAEARGPEPWADVFVAEANRMGAQAGLAPVSARDVVPGLAEIEDMTEEDRQAAIRSMVEGLAARLEAEPDDPEGWLRLAQARAVLGEPGAAREAYDRALEVLPPDDPRREAVEAARADLP